ncbi:hypothetical protein BSL78_15480 [Apostichopus japonicus]|uniref:Endonuclease/exonuclease/phosphatase domain-containing protein n=1 Tax=Stichopus japonicus TaxID=307972 RepID=A0A2G8KI54_STIJA|nr:hypothetical protein BSL78_15480 [Apostichopus japonicus]
MFQKLVQLLLSLFLFYHNSTLNRGLLRRTAEALGVKKLIPTRTGGTRWIGHTQAALNNLLSGYPAIIQHWLEIKDHNKTSADSKGKSAGFIKLLLSRTFLELIHFVVDITSILSILSRTFQKRDMNMQSIPKLVDDTIHSLEKLKTHWCNNLSVKQKICTPDIESLTIGLRPFYLPREFTQILVTAVYIHPKANADNAHNQLKATINRIENSHPDAVNLIMGDFNHCKIDDLLPTYTQYIDLPTRNNTTLDMCYGNVNGSNYKVKALAQLGSSDHSIIHMSPKYHRELERSKPIEKTQLSWNKEAVDQLRGCFECTDWNVFDDPNLQDTTTTVTEYINFCADLIIPKKSFRIFPNSKPWLSKELKSLVYEKKAAFSSGDFDLVKTKQREIKKEVKRCKKSTERNWKINLKGVIRKQPGK